MTWWLLTLSALLLGIERIVYVLIGYNPERFCRWCAKSGAERLGEPVDVVRALFLLFKAIQAGVFVVWICLHTGGAPRPSDGGLTPIAIGSAFIVLGQLLNFWVFVRLGTTGVFYGNRLGHHVPWCEAFPFTVARHPQYVGTVLSIWGLFLITRFPHPDWYLLPALETAYYGLGARLER